MCVVACLHVCVCVFVCVCACAGELTSLFVCVSVYFGLSSTGACLFVCLCVLSAACLFLCCVFVFLQVGVGK